MQRLAVFASGTGSTLEGFINAGIPIVLVVADRPCRALTIAETANIPALLLARTDHGWPKEFDRTAYTRSVADALAQHQVDLVALAGFMTILGSQICVEYEKRIINTHPALLPKHKGHNGVGDALASGDTVTGYTIHYITAEVDDGEVLVQEEVAILEGDTEDTLHARIKAIEGPGYTKVLKNLLGL